MSVPGLSFDFKNLHPCLFHDDFSIVNLSEGHKFCLCCQNMAKKKNHKVYLKLDLKSWSFYINISFCTYFVVKIVMDCAI